VLPELVELNRIRLDENLSYEKLGKRIGIRGATLQRLLNNRRRKPYDRTLHKIRLFLAKFADRETKNARPKRRRRASAETRITS
jgi:transcriptional regulator with XRE-family HTH domain